MIKVLDVDYDSGDNIPEVIQKKFTNNFIYSCKIISVETLKVAEGDVEGTIRVWYQYS